MSHSEGAVFFHMCVALMGNSNSAYRFFYSREER